MIKLIIYIILISIVVLSAQYLKKQKDKKKKILPVVSISLCSVLIVGLLLNLGLPVKSNLSNELDGVEEIKIPEALLEEVDKAYSTQLFGESVKATPYIRSGIYRKAESSDEILELSYFYLRGYRFESAEIAEKSVKRLMTDPEMNFLMTDSLLYTLPLKLNLIIRGESTYLKIVPFYWATKIKTVGDTSVYSTLTALTAVPHGRSSLMVGLPCDSAITVFAIRQGEYVFVFCEWLSQGTDREASYFTQWLEESKGWTAIIDGRFDNAPESWR